MGGKTNKKERETRPAPSNAASGSKRAKPLKYDQKKLAKQAQQQQQSTGEHVHQSGPPQSALPPMAYNSHALPQQQQQDDEQRSHWEAQQYQMHWQYQQQQHPYYPPQQQDWHHPYPSQPAPPQAPCADEPSETALRSRKNGQRATSPMPLPLAPRTSYLVEASRRPSRYAVELNAGEAAPRTSPLPLLLLDLNGTLVYRGGAGNSANPTPRPYLSAFLAYALGVHVPCMSLEQRRKEWSAWNEERIVEGLAGGHEATRLSSKPHGANFWPTSPALLLEQGVWKSHALEPQPAPNATFRILLWSSAQRRNVDAMTRAILAPQQAEHVLRVWARDTLVPDRWMGSKAASTKDLEIVWAALNVDAQESKLQAPQEEEDREGAKRLMAQYRAHVDLAFADEHGVACSAGQEEQEQGAGPAAARLAALQAQAFLRPPSLWPNEVPGRGYGQHNTLLLDDSPDKARLQPYSHLLLPEFDAQRAALVKQWRRRTATHPQPLHVSEAPLKADVAQQPTSTGQAMDAGSEGTSDYATPPSSSSYEAPVTALRAPTPTPHESQLDDVLLQLVGVLAHARWERNVSAWIYAGGLGYFGGMSQPGMQVHPTSPPSPSPLTQLHEEAQTETDQSQPNLALDTPSERRTQSFWAREGRKALKMAGIACSVD